jgi:hypothetical protein
MLHQEADPANDHQCDTGNEKEREKSRLPVLAWRSVRGEVGGLLHRPNPKPPDPGVEDEAEPENKRPLGQVMQCAKSTSRSRRGARSRQHEDVEQFGAGNGAEGVQAFPDSALWFVGSHGVEG